MAWAWRSGSSNRSANSSGHRAQAPTAMADRPGRVVKQQGAVRGLASMRRQLTRSACSGWQREARVLLLEQQPDESHPRRPDPRSAGWLSASTGALVCSDEAPEAGPAREVSPARVPVWWRIASQRLADQLPRAEETAAVALVGRRTRRGERDRESRNSAIHSGHRPAERPRGCRS